MSSAASAAHPLSTEQLEQAITTMRERVRRLPSDATAWAMLAHSQEMLGNYADASTSYARLVELRPKDPQVLADAADSLALANGRKLAGAPMQLITRALALDPNNLKALSLAATEAFERKDPAAAIAYWQRARAQITDATLGQELDANIALARAQQARAASGVGDVVGGRIVLSDKLKDRVAAGDTLFVFARPVEGSRMPVALMRKRASELPLEFKLDDSMAMVPQNRLSLQSRVVIGATHLQARRRNARQRRPAGFQRTGECRHRGLESRDRRGGAVNCARHDILRHGQASNACAQALLILLLAASPAWAVLGGGVADVQGEQLRMHATRAVATNFQGGSVHELRLADGSSIRQYINAQGVVYAVAWSTRVKPNFAQLFGRYAADFNAGAADALRTPGIKRKSSSTMATLLCTRPAGRGAFVGKAWLKSQVPAGSSRRCNPLSRFSPIAPCCWRRVAALTGLRRRHDELVNVICRDPSVCIRRWQHQLTPTGPNTTEIVVDRGPVRFGLGVTNVPYVTVTVCRPGATNGSTVDCVTIDHVLLDTGSYGLRVLKSKVDGSPGQGLPAVPVAADASNGTPAGDAAECYPFVLGAVWGPLAKADVRIADELAPAQTIQLIDDSQSPRSLPPAGLHLTWRQQGALLSSVSELQANGILGIGSVNVDCGIGCEPNMYFNMLHAVYYSCPTNGDPCVPAGMAMAAQVQNPVANFVADGNGSSTTTAR